MSEYSWEGGGVVRMEIDAKGNRVTRYYLPSKGLFLFDQFDGDRDEDLVQINDLSKSQDLDENIDASQDLDENIDDSRFKLLIDNLLNQQLVKITLVKSTIGRLPTHRRTARALGLTRVGKSVIHVNADSIMGMANQIGYLVKIEHLIAPESAPQAAPETDAPVADAPETDAPVADAPETDAPVADAPETDGAGTGPAGPEGSPE